MPTFYPTNIGYLPTGVNGVAQVSSVFVGRAVSGTYEGVGFGQGGRPDYAQVVQINLSSVAGGVATQKGSITMNVADIVAIAGVPANLNLVLKEVTVCDSGTTKKMVILGSQLYT